MEPATLYCSKCDKHIPVFNYQIHQAMCRGPRRDNLETEYSPSFLNSSSSRMSRRSNISSQNRSRPYREPPVVEERFPCSECGYQMTMAELDTHPQQCVIKLRKCDYCMNQFPEMLMEQHLQVCQQRPRMPLRPSAQEFEDQEEIIIQDEDERAFVSPRRRHSMLSNRMQQRSDNPLFARRSSSRRRRQAEESMSLFDRLRRPIRPYGEPVITINFGNSGAVLFVSSQGAPFMIRGDFIQQLMARLGFAQGEHQGLDQEEIAKIPVVKYDETTNGSKCHNCTICMTDFQKGDQAVQLKCGHLFNRECIVPWLKSSSACPNCRASVRDFE